jgi:hypothetical protein
VHADQRLSHHLVERLLRNAQAQLQSDQMIASAASFRKPIVSCSATLGSVRDDERLAQCGQWP